MGLYDRFNPYVAVQTQSGESDDTAYKKNHGGGLTIIGRDIHTLIPHTKLNYRPSYHINDLTTVFMKRKHSTHNDYGRLLIQLGDMELCIDRSPRYYDMMYDLDVNTRVLIERLKEKGYDLLDATLEPFLVTKCNISKEEKEYYGEIRGCIKIECEFNKRLRRHFRVTLGFIDESETIRSYDSDNSIVITKNELLKLLDAFTYVHY